VALKTRRRSGAGGGGGEEELGGQEEEEGSKTRRMTRTCRGAAEGGERYRGVCTKYDYRL